jgi:hypothetical protein
MDLPQPGIKGGPVRCGADLLSLRLYGAILGYVSNREGAMTTRGKTPDSGEPRPGGKIRAGRSASAGPANRGRTPEVREGRAAPAAEPRVRKNYLLSQALISEAKRVLGKKTETETIEESLRMAIFSQRIAAGAEQAFGYPWEDAFGEEQPTSPNAPVP